MLFEAEQLILDGLINDPFICPHKPLDKVFNSTDFTIDQFTPSKASLKKRNRSIESEGFLNDEGRYDDTFKLLEKRHDVEWGEFDSL